MRYSNRAVSSSNTTVNKAVTKKVAYKSLLKESSATWPDYMMLDYSVTAYDIWELYDIFCQSYLQIMPQQTEF